MSEKKDENDAAHHAIVTRMVFGERPSITDVTEAIRHDLRTLNDWRGRQLPTTAENEHAAKLAAEMGSSIENMGAFGIHPEDLLSEE